MKNLYGFLGVLIWVTGALAGVIRVPVNQPTIQAGINAADDGDTVLVADSTYFENINFQGKPITVASHFLLDGDTTHINNTIINGSQPTDPNKGSVVSFVSGEDTASVICGFTITGGTGTLYDANDRVGGGIYCKISGARIVHNKIVSNTVNHTNASQGGGIGYWPQTNSIAHYVIVEDNVIESNSITSSNGGSYLNGGGIYIVKGRITGNTIRYNSVSGRPIFAGGGGISTGCENSANRTLVVITGNTITHNQAKTSGYYGGWGAGVDVVMCNVQILDNTIAYNEAGGSYGKGAGIRLWGSKAISIIKNNTISFNSVTAPGAGGGIELDQTQGVRVIGNRIEGNNGSLGGGGIDESRCSDSGNLIDGNYIKNNIGGEQGGGIWAMSAKIINNVVAENEARRGGGIFYYYHPSFASNLAQIINNTITENVADTAGGIAIYRSNAVVMNTLCWGNIASHGPEIEMWGGTLNAAHSDIQFGSAGIVIDSTATVNWLAGNIDTNPLFTFPQYQLSKSSPCIGAGIDAIKIGNTWHSSPTVDIAGNPRPDPDGTMPDIGAYENPLNSPEGPIRVPEQYATIQAGINAANAGDWVLVADGTYFENINFQGKPITVASYFLLDGDTTHINNTVIDGSKPTNPDSGSVVFFVSGEDTTSILCGFTITGGTGTETIEDANNIVTPCRAGGGIFCNNGFAKILHNKIINNTVISKDKEVIGGGLVAMPFSSNAWVVLQNNQISHNTIKTTTGAAIGGGLEIGCNAILLHNLISNNTIVHNSNGIEQAGGGGLDCSSYSFEMRTIIAESNHIIYNSVTSSSTNTGVAAFSGGVSIWGTYKGRFFKNEVCNNVVLVNADRNGAGSGMLIGEVTDAFTIEGNLIRENAVTHGNGYGGGFNIHTNSSPTLINNIINGNSATNGGGFLIGGSSIVKLVNNTIINNMATTGAGIYISSSSTVYLMNTILWGNQALASPGIHNVSSTVKAAYCNIQGDWSGNKNFGDDPQFADTLFHLADHSRCIGAGAVSYDFGGGVTCGCPESDFAGNIRPNPAESDPDIGALESPLKEPRDVGMPAIPANALPKSFSLSQNFPNPFNPVTRMEFALPKAAFVTLKIYNLLGEDVATLVSEKLPAGMHKFNWDATGLASGVYLCRLDANDPSTSSGRRFVQVIKLALVK